MYRRKIKNRKKKQKQKQNKKKRMNQNISTLRTLAELRKKVYGGAAFKISISSVIRQKGEP